MLIRMVVVLFATLCLTGAMAAELEADRASVEVAFPNATGGKATLLGCLVPPENKAMEACAFQAGEGIAISFVFDAETKAIMGVSALFAEDEADLAIAIMKAALKFSRYEKADRLDYRGLMKQASLMGKEVKVSKGVVARLRKMPPSLYAFGFIPAAE